MKIQTFVRVREALDSAIDTAARRGRNRTNVVAIACCMALAGGLVIWAGWNFSGASAASTGGSKVMLSKTNMLPVDPATSRQQSVNDGKKDAAPGLIPDPPPVVFGDANTDFPVVADFDGDGKTDIAYYREGAPSVFSYIRSIDSAVVDVQFGQTGDRSFVTGDYDGDKKADPAVFRCPAVGQPCSFIYLPSLGGGPVTVDWGVGVPASTFIASYPGDFDGDGKYDFCVYRLNGSSQWEFLLRRSSDSQTETIVLGNFNSDYLVPGDYDGDGKSDFMLARTGGTSSTPLQWTLLTRTGGGPQAPITFGISSDTPVPADYDGDGKTDIALRRRTDTTFQIRRSSDASTWVVVAGLSGDFAVGTWNVQ